jgi:4-amino-4-deoxy-L-arabinose transferase-like glycosyltransferase
MIEKSPSKKPPTKKSVRSSRTAVAATPVATAPLRDEAPGSWSSNLSRWCTQHAYLSLALATIACLIPFSGRAFHVDDTLFVRAARQIAAHPLDPYGFEITWDTTPTPMSDVTQNPPLASYYMALVAQIAGWSERTIHLGFILVAVALVLGTYRLASKFTESPWLAAFATLIAPGVMVSAASVMCDTMMLTLWVWAAVLWIEGLDTGKTHLLIISGALTGASALTKYFGAALIPLLLVYSIVRLRRAGAYLVCLLIPVAMLAGYEFWTDNLYGHGLLQGAADFAQEQRAHAKSSLPAMVAICLSFTGGCSLLGAFFAPWVWSRKSIAAGVAAGGALSYALIANWFDVGLHIGTGIRPSWRWFIGPQLVVCIAGGLSILALAVKDLHRKRNADSLFLALWVGGTFFFAAILNYTVNARSVLPLIPAVAILLARHFDVFPPRSPLIVAAVLLVSGALSLWVTAADSELGNSARTAANLIFDKTHGRGGNVFFEGHWGFQYYMESKGAEPLDIDHPDLQSGDFIVIPHNNTETRELQPDVISSEETIELPLKSKASTISYELGAGFYSSYWGPLPFAFGPARPETYTIQRFFQRDGSTPMN